MIKRIQRKRTKGWKMPDNAISVCRPHKWGNPLKIQGDMIYVDASYRRSKLDKWVFLRDGDIDDVIYLYRKLWDGTQFKDPDLQFWADRFFNLNLNELKGKNLACFCSLDSMCHADVLISLANVRGQYKCSRRV